MLFNRLSKRVQWALSLITALAIVVTGIAPAQATHLRGAMGTLTYNHTTKKVLMESVLLEATTWTQPDTFFTFPTITRVDRATGAQTSVAPCTGQATTATASTSALTSSNVSSLPNATFSDKTSQPLFYINTSRFTIDVSCVNFNTNFDYIFSQTAGNRINGIKNTTNLTVQVESKIRIDGANDAAVPVYNSGLMTNVAYDPTVGNFFTTNLNALAGGYGSTVAPGAQISYTLINDQSSALGGYGSSRIPCSDFNTTTGVLRIGASLCTGSENYATAFNGGTAAAPIYYAIKTRATDAASQYTTRDVLLAFSGAGTNRAPVFTTKPSTLSYTLTPGTTTTINLVASDLDANQKVDFTTNNLPSWATLSKVVPASGALPATYATYSTATLTLSPPVGLSTTSQIEVDAFDVSTNTTAIFSLATKIQFDIAVGSALLPPASPGQPTVTPGTSGTLSYTFAAPVGGGAVPAPTGYTAQAFAVGSTVGVPAVPQVCAQTAGFTNSVSCTISGLTNGTLYTIVVTATNAAGTATSPPSVATAPTGPQPPVITLSKTSLSLPTNVAVVTSGSTANVYTINATTVPSNAIASYTISPSLPTGLSFNSASGLITGTPSVASPATTYTVTALGTVSGMNGTATFTLSVGLLTNTITFTQPWGMMIPTSGTTKQNLTASATAGSGVTFTIDSSSTSNCSLSSSQIQITSSTTAGTCVVNANHSGGSGYGAAPTVTKTFYIFIASSLSNSCPATNSTTVGPVIYLTQNTGAFTVNSAVSAGTSITNSFKWINAGAPGASFSSTGNPTACTTGLTMAISPAVGNGLTFGTTGTSVGQITGTPSTSLASTNYLVSASVKSSASGNPTLSSPTAPYSYSIAGLTQTITFNSITGRGIADGQFVTGSTGNVATPTTDGIAKITTTTTSATAALLGRRDSSSDSSNTIRIFPNIAGTSSTIPVGGTFTVSGSSNVVAVKNGTYTVAGSGNGTTVPTGGSFYWKVLVGSSATTSPANTMQANTSNNNGGYGNAIDVSGTITYQLATPVTTLTNSPNAVTMVSNSPSTCTVSGTSAVGFTITPLAVGTCSLTASAAATNVYKAATPVTQEFAISSKPVLAVSPSSATYTALQPVSSAFTLTNTGGGNITSYSISPAVPDGLFFDSSTGILSGAAEKSQPATTYTITATNSVGTSIGVQFSLTILKAAQTLRFDPLNGMVLGDPNQATTTLVTPSGLAASVTVDSATTNVCSIVNGAVHALSAGTCSITATQAGDATWAQATPVTRTVVIAAAITKPVLAIDTPSATIKRGLQIFAPYLLSNSGGAAVSYAISPDPGPLGLTFDVRSGLIPSGLVANTANTTVFSITATNSAGTSTPVSFTLNVVKQGQNISFATLGNTTTATHTISLDARATSGLTVTFTSSTTSVCTVSGTTLTITSTGGTCTVNADQAGNDAVYDAAPTVTQSFYVIAAPVLSVSPSTGTRTSDIHVTVGSNVPASGTGSLYAITGTGNTTGSAVTYSYSGNLPSGLSFDPATGLVSGIPDTASGTSVTFTVTASNAVGTSASWTFNIFVDKKSQSILTFKQPSAMIASTTQQLVAVASSGLPVVFAVDPSSASICSVSGNTLTASSSVTGTTAQLCRLILSQPGDNIWDAATTNNIQIARRRAAAPTYNTTVNVYGQIVAPALPASSPDVTLQVYNAFGTVISAPVNTGGPAASWSISNGAALTALGLAFDATTGEITVLDNGHGEGPVTVTSGTTFTITATNSSSSSSSTLKIIITKAPAAVVFDQATLAATYSPSTPRPVTFTIDTNSTTIDGSTLVSSATVSYSGSGYGPSATPPTNAGTYTVSVTCVDIAFTCSGSETLVISKANAGLTVNNVVATYDGARHAATATTTPSGLTVGFIYDASTSNAPISVGIHTVVATISDANYSGIAVASVTINAIAANYIVAPSQTVVYNGTVQVPTVTTSNSGLPAQYTITLNGDIVTGFTDVGTYAYAINSADPNYTGSTSGTFIVTPAPQVIHFSSFGSVYIGDPDQSASAYTTSPDANGSQNNSPVTLTSQTSSVCSIVAGAVHLLTVGLCTVRASAAAVGNFAQATPVDKSFNIGFRIGGNTAISTNVGVAPASVYTLPSSGTSPCTWSISPALPSGMSISTSTGLLSGTPTAASASATYTLTCTVGSFTTTGTFTLEVLKIAQTVSLTTASSATYGDADFAYTASATSNLAVSVTSSNTSVVTVNTSTGKLHIVGVGTAIITVAQGGNGTYSAATSVTQTVTVSAKHLSYSGITATNRAYAPGVTSVAITGATLNGVVSGDTVTHGVITGAVSTDAAGTGIAVILSGGSIGGTDSGKYVLDPLPSNITVNIAKATQTITFPSLGASAIIGASQSVNVTASSGLSLVFGQDASSAAACSISYAAPTLTVVALAAGACTITASQAGNNNYFAATDAIRSFTVASSLAAPIGSLLNGSSIAVSSSVPVTLIATKPVGNPYSIGNAGGTVDSYHLYSSYTDASTNTPVTYPVAGVTFDTTTGLLSGIPTALLGVTPFILELKNNTGSSFVTLYLQVIKADQVVTLAPAQTDVTYGDVPFAANAVSDTTGQIVTVTSSNNGVVTWNSSTGNIEIVGAGVATVTASSAGDMLVNGDSSPAVTITVDTRQVSISGLQATNRPYAPGVLSIALTGGNLTNVYSGQPITFSGVTGTVPSANVGTYTVSLSGGTLSGTGSSNYVLVLPTGPSVEVTQATQTLTLSSLSATVFPESGNGQAFSASSSSGLPVTITASPSGVCEILNGYVHAIGVGTCIVTVSQAGNSNYQSASSSVSFSVGTAVVAPAISASPTQISLTVNSNVTSAANITSTGGAGTWTITSALTNACANANGLPTGMSWDPATGMISGTPTVAGEVCSVVVTLTNVSGVSSVTLTFTIAKMTQVVSLSSSTGAHLGDPDFGYSALSSATGLVVNVASSNTAVITVDQTSHTVHIVGIGVATLIATQPGNGTYLAATPATVMVTISTAPVVAPASGSSPTPVIDPTPVAPPTLTPAPKPFVLPPLGPVPFAKAPAGGEGLVTQDGTPLTASLGINTGKGELAVTDSTWTVAVSSTDLAGKPAQVTSTGQIVLEQGKYARATGTGFRPNTDVHLYVFSSPILLGILETDASGNFTGALPIPAGIEIGNHTIQVVGYAPEGTIRSASVPAVVQAPVGKVLAAKFYFTPGSPTITASAAKLIKKFAAKLPKKYTDLNVGVVGFVYPYDTKAANQKVSSLRAKNVANMLKKLGFKGLFVVKGMGRAAESDKSARRVEVTVTYKVKATN